MKMYIDPKKELFVWGPIEGVLHYPWYFCVAIVKMFPKVYRVHWPEIIFSFVDQKMTFLCEYGALRASGWEVAKRWVLPRTKYTLARYRFDRAVGKLNAISREVIRRLNHNSARTTPNPSSLRRGNESISSPARGEVRRGGSVKEYTELYRQWEKAYLDFWLHGLIPEIANWGQEKFLMDALAQRGLRGQEYLHALEVLSAPSGIGFFQEAEKELLKIAMLHNPPQPSLNLREGDRLVSPLKVRGGKGELWTALKKHAQKYFWLHNSYYGTQVLTARDFERMFREEVKKGDIAKRIRDIDQGPVRRAKAKEKLIHKLKLTALEARVARALGDTVSWQDERKKYVWQAGHVIDLFLQEAARRAGVSFALCKDLLPNEVEQVLQGRKIDVRRLTKERLVSAIHFTKAWQWQIVTGTKARTLLAPYKRTAHGVAEVSGLVVSQGPKVRGRVRIIFSPQKEQKHMKQGDILVTSMTSPDYIVVMKRAGAIVTDEGGMTSHAAVVSRELGIPCIVGTKVATQVFKDGDRVEVDTGKGIVRKL